MSDIMMPHMSGYELAKRIREQFSISELPILFLTARQQREDIQIAFLSGANDYVKKPMEYVELKSRVNALVRVKQSSEERLRIEAAWLQAQIQPHFFFNTLSSIISLHGVDDTQMEELLLAFSNYLQMSFDFQNADLVVPIDYELKLVRSYIAIEQIRFGDRVQVIWDIPENIELSIPPLSIQTLDENAVQHGILPQRGGGTVTIRIVETEQHFNITISDNGVGFDNTDPKEKTSVGLVNTEQRLNQLFGVELTIESVVGQGTTISFPIPKK
ncbi:histidine kinase [Lysinibacillus sp. NPDC097231]|uniref:histidine kinase n=1 Tax=Lysinibacillus sp. NPDC097231 TaxID=3364142 RepID=UPI00381D23AE